MSSCELCRRAVEVLTRHHLIPVGQDGRHGPTAQLCLACHQQIHMLFDNATLARELDSLEKLRRNGKVRRFLRWVRKQSPDRRIKVRPARSRH